jgi:hypothetical protein
LARHSPRQRIGAPPARWSRQLSAPRDPSSPTAGDLHDDPIVKALVTGAAIVPGFLLCVPGLTLVVVPFVVTGVLGATAGLVDLVKRDHRPGRMPEASTSAIVSCATWRCSSLV